MMDRMNRYSNATSKGLGAGTPMFAKGSCANMRTKPMVKDKTISANHTSAPAAVGNANERKPIINPSGTTTKPTSGTMSGLETKPANEKWPKKCEIKGPVPKVASNGTAK